MENESLTHYMRVAVSLAERIAAGELREGEKLSGRSKLSPEYNVSPETVRRALRLLADMKVVEVKEQSGVYILSADNAGATCTCARAETTCRKSSAACAACSPSRSSCTGR